MRIAPYLTLLLAPVLLATTADASRPVRRVVNRDISLYAAGPVTAEGWEGTDHVRTQPGGRVTVQRRLIKARGAANGTLDVGTGVVALHWFTGPKAGTTTLHVPGRLAELPKADRHQPRADAPTGPISPSAPMLPFVRARLRDRLAPAR